jgi:hypothetical protein
MAEVVFTYCLALHVFRAGVRRNNSCAINAGKTKFSPLSFGLNMPIYMETYIRDSFFRLQCPEKVRVFLEENDSYSVSGNDSKGEGGDFILESKTRKTKMWIQNGVTDNKWLNVCRCIDNFEKVNKKFKIMKYIIFYSLMLSVSNSLREKGISIQCGLGEPWTWQ